MNTKTHKAICATFEPAVVYYAVPAFWDLENIMVEDGILYYKNQQQLDVQRAEGFKERLTTIMECDEDTLTEYFSCEDEDEDAVVVPQKLKS
jgi:hypothetical protein